MILKFTMKIIQKKLKIYKIHKFNSTKNFNKLKRYLIKFKKNLFIMKIYISF